jgi:hypothetical protein
VTLEETLLDELDLSCRGVGALLLEGFEHRPRALEQGAVWQEGYARGVREALAGLEEGLPLIVARALERTARAQN